MLSRVAEAIYWMNRYIERAENVARFIHVNLHLVLDLGAVTGEQWEPLVWVTGDHQAFAERCGTATREQVIDFLTFDQDNPNSILSCLFRARENARSVREIISSEMWEQINRFYLLVKGAARERALETPHDFFTEIKMASHLYGGIADSTMSRGEGWHLGRLGGLLERADKTSRILDVKYFILLPDPADVGTPVDNVQWAALLRSASAFEMYRKRFGLIAPERIADFLILDREFPRAIHHCLIEGEESLRTLTGSAAGTFHNEAEQELGRLRAELSYAQIEEVIAVGLHEFLDDLQLRLNRIDMAIFSTFFALRPLAGAKT
ncbi:MAG: alpha-E domain-containing protein [Candidatus Latescibacteria bacterium]|nr:alpha-E domain-containing protein [Candidatus Latescibacterota bacterium]